MKTIGTENICKNDFNIYNIMSKKQYWKSGESYSNINGRRLNCFLLLKSCSAKITFADGMVVSAAEGDLLYIPKYLKYTIRFFDCAKNEINSYVINFHAGAADGSEILFSDKAEKIPIQSFSEVERLTEQIAAESEKIESSPAVMKSAVYSICANTKYEHANRFYTNDYRIISKGVSYLQSHVNENVKIDDLAKICSVSRSCFGKTFKKYYGLSPKEYILERKIEKAKDLLESGLYNVSETASVLGFEDTSYFSKLFKKKTNRMPSAYLKR